MDGKTRESRRHNASSSAASWRSCRGSQVAAEKASKWNLNEMRLTVVCDIFFCGYEHPIRYEHKKKRIVSCICCIDNEQCGKSINLSHETSRDWTKSMSFCFLTSLIRTTKIKQITWMNILRLKQITGQSILCSSFGTEFQIGLYLEVGTEIKSSPNQSYPVPFELAVLFPFRIPL